jgi:hypothetical protein
MCNKLLGGYKAFPMACGWQEIISNATLDPRAETGGSFVSKQEFVLSILGRHDGLLFLSVVW